MNMAQFTIGQLAKAAKVKVSTIRYYERIGLVLPHLRSPSGYRLYQSQAISTLHFIKNAQHLGFSLEESRALLQLEANTLTNCEDIKKQVLEIFKYRS